MLKKTVFIFILLLLNIAPLFPQEQQDLFRQMIRAFQNLKFETAEKIARQITSDYESYSPSQLLEAHKILGIIAFQRDMNLPEAQIQFEQALSIDRTTRLDSVNASLKTINFFNDLKTKFISKPAANQTEETIHYRYHIQPDPRPAATLRSMVLPGWGQLYKNDKKKGYALITSTVIFHVAQNNAHQDYLNETNPSIIKKKYDKYNRYYQLRNTTALIGGGIWLYAFFDVLIAKPKPRAKKIDVAFHVFDHPRVSAQIAF